MDSQVNTPVSVFAGFLDDEDLVMFASCDNLHTRIAASVAVENHLNLIDAIVVLGQLRSLFLRVPSNRFRYVDVFAADSE